MADTETSDSLGHQWYLYGKGQYDEGNFAGAYESLEEALRAPGTEDEHKPGIWYLQAVCLLNLHRVDEADALAERAGAEHASGYAEHKQRAAGDSLGHRWYEHAMAKYQEGSYQEAFDSIVEALQAPGTGAEQRPGLLHMQAVCLLALGRRDEADALSAEAGHEYREEYERKLQDFGYNAAELGQSMGHQWYMHARAAYDGGDYQTAYDSLGEALQAPGTEDEHKPGIFVLQAICLLHLDRVDEGDAIAVVLGGDELAQYEAKKAELGL